MSRFKIKVFTVSPRTARPATATVRSTRPPLRFQQHRPKLRPLVKHADQSSMQSVLLDYVVAEAIFAVSPELVVASMESGR